MRIVSYNVNSLRKRLHLLEEIVKIYDPEIICLQEIKISTENDFPFDFFRDFGFNNLKFQLSLKGQGGVLIASKKTELVNHCSLNFFEQGQGFHECSERHLSVEISLHDQKISIHNLYVPSGGSGAEEVDLESKKFLDKLSFLRSMIYFFEQNKSENKIVIGDLNVAPFENDVFNHKQLLKVISHTKEETDLFKGLLEKGNLADIGRIFFSENEKIFSWWSYRSKNWQQTNRGRRLDHILVSENFAQNIKKFEILVDFRKKESPSDHCPILFEI
jgi:exodeoxyribonuclease-3